MDDVVAVRVTTESGSRIYFMTWGRIQDAVQTAPLEALIHAYAARKGFKPVRAEVCASLQDAADQPYFFECLLAMAHGRIPFGPVYEAWRVERDCEMREGREIHFLGRAREDRP